LPKVVFTNELGNRIVMTMETDSVKGVRITAVGPTSTVDHTWTHEEASWLGELLTGTWVDHTKQHQT
jgi:hypothetical protein